MNEIPAGYDDQQLIRLTLDGDRDAFGGLVRRYQDRLYNSMVHILRNEAEAEDSVQEAFILALTKLDTFRGQSGFFTWLYRIAYNVAVTRIRRRKPTLSIENAHGELRLDLPGDQPLPDAGLLKRERAEQLMQALNRMSEEHRVILVLREMDEMDYAQISEVLELPIGTVRSRLHRARIQLKELLESMQSD
jgi:RNA polymerase sigma-70 factor (ECF subfamily)